MKRLFLIFLSIHFFAFADDVTIANQPIAVYQASNYTTAVKPSTEWQHSFWDYQQDYLQKYYNLGQNAYTGSPANPPNFITWPYFLYYFSNLFVDGLFLKDVTDPVKRVAPDSVWLTNEDGSEQEYGWFDGMSKMAYSNLTSVAGIASDVGDIRDTVLDDTYEMDGYTYYKYAYNTYALTNKLSDFAANALKGYRTSTFPLANVTILQNSSSHTYGNFYEAAIHHLKTIEQVSVSTLNAFATVDQLLAVVATSLADPGHDDDKRSFQDTLTSLQQSASQVQQLGQSISLNQSEIIANWSDPTQNLAQHLLPTYSAQMPTALFLNFPGFTVGSVSMPSLSVELETSNLASFVEAVRFFFDIIYCLILVAFSIAVFWGLYKLAERFVDLLHKITSA